MIWTSDFPPEVALGLCARIAAAGTVLACLEYLVQPYTLSDDSLMSWAVCRLRSPALVAGPLATLLHVALSAKGVRVLLFVRLFLALAILLLAPNSPALLLLAGLAGMLFIQRSPFGHDGADQLMMILFLALGIGAAVGTIVGIQLALGFLAAQAVLAYVTAGTAKASAAGWRNGSFLIGIAGMRMYGHARCAHVFATRPRLAHLVALATIAWEIGFVAVPLLPPGPAFAYLALGVGFHVGNAFIMGLNTFFFAFVATYPALACWILRR